jgi:hypothetical protein
MINSNYCLDISDNINKCFCLYLSPEPGGRTKSFHNLVDLIANSIFASNIIKNSLSILRLEALIFCEALSVKKVQLKYFMRSLVKLFRQII